MNQETKFDAELLTHARGAMIGALAGDAAGATLEFLGRKPFAAEVENAMRMVGGGIWKTAPGQVTDDGELTLALALGLAGQSAYDRNRVARAYRHWFLSSPFDVGHATHNALSEGDPASPDFGAQMWLRAAQKNRDSKANGSLMRASAIGVWGAGRSIGSTVYAALFDARLTHPNPTCQWAGVAYVVAIRHLLLNPGDAAGALKLTADILDEVEGDAKEVRSWLGDALRGELPASHPQAGYIRIAFTWAFHHLSIQTSYESAIFATLSGGGDTDTNACIVGGLIGALHGEKGIPETMRNAVLHCDTHQGRSRPEWLQTKQVDALIVRLLQPTTW
ncbi:ADP-ribosylglycohydrolase family protein [Propionivibrio sp.]|uniref:ADP-ribosylglycohydrolase family protein n=1 Tax=Propionivibrio sp. TaxID=2212460 RepID=UPI0026256EBB|nr:ADP-ribosylglycohydrolase family protein [Propionivibrio sp.]